MIEIKRLKKSYEIEKETIDILFIDSLNIQSGERVAITGQSGSGKSTLLHILGGVIEANDGHVIINNTNVLGLSQSKRDSFRKQNIGYIFQDFYLIPSLTAEENVKLVLGDVPKKLKATLIEEWFEKVGLSNRKKHLPSQLSRGQQQRVAIIRALIHNPAIVLADEPTGSLDVETAQETMGLLLSLCKEQKKTLLCVTHDQVLAHRFPRIIKMDDVNAMLQRREMQA